MGGAISMYGSQAKVRNNEAGVQRPRGAPCAVSRSLRLSGGRRRVSAKGKMCLHARLGHVKRERRNPPEEPRATELCASASVSSTSPSSGSCATGERGRRSVASYCALWAKKAKQGAAEGEEGRTS
jgi:hypothetical protein